MRISRIASDFFDRPLAPYLSFTRQGTVDVAGVCPSPLRGISPMFSRRVIVFGYGGSKTTERCEGAVAVSAKGQASDLATAVGGYLVRSLVCLRLATCRGSSADEHLGATPLSTSELSSITRDCARRLWCVRPSAIPDGGKRKERRTRPTGSSTSTRAKSSERSCTVAEPRTQEVPR
jgi:hypothetical protein